ncbi:hypothetical protein N2152v2_009883 [Parachlorella kessleri]
MACNSSTHHKWQPSSGLQTVEQLLDELASHLAWHGGSTQLVAELDGFAVLPSSGLGLLREGDLLTLKHNPCKRKAAPAAEPAAQPAGKKPKVGQGLVRAVGRQQGKQEQQQGPQLQQQLQQEQGIGSRSSDSSSSSEGSESEQRSESSPESSSASESSPESSEGARQQADVDAKSERFYTPAAKLVSPGIQQRASAGEETLGGPETGGTATGGAAAGKPRPSRSARRKAVKRRLKREGLLPPSTGKKATAQPQPPQPQQQQQKQPRQQQQPGENGGGPGAAPATGGATARGGDQAAGHGAQPAQKQQSQQHQRQPRANGSTKPADGLVAAPEANAYSPHPAVLHQPARHAGTRLAPAPPPGKAAAVAKAGQRRQVAGDVGSMLHASGLKARNITPDGHVYFADDSSSSGKSELSSDEESGGVNAAQQQLAAGGSRQNAADLAVARTGREQVPVPQADGAAGAAAAASAETVTRGAAALPQPMAEFEFARLPAVRGMPSVGSVVAYKFLEMGPSYAPQVSEVRLGRVIEADGQSQSLTLEPHPDPATHPLAWQWAAARAAKAAEAAASGEEGDEMDEEEEQELGLYEEDGMLAAELSSFVELRLLDPAAPPRTELADKAAAPRVVYSQAAREPTQGTHAAATATAKTAAVVPSDTGAAAPAGGGDVALGDLGPSSYSQLGPPRPAGAMGTGGTVIPAKGGWASLHQQLQQRRAELARQQQQQEQQRRQAGPSSGAPKSCTPANSNGQLVVQSPLEHPQRPPQQQGSSRQATTAAASPSGTHAGEAHGGGKRPQGLTPGATKPRGGVRASAMGPILRMLRSSNELE